MIWTICCNSLNSREKKTTFQSFLNVMKIKEFSSKNNAEELRFKAHYEVVKERDLGEKIRFLNENHHNSKCTLVSILLKMKKISGFTNKWKILMFQNFLLLMKSYVKLKSPAYYQDNPTTKHNMTM